MSSKNEKRDAVREVKVKADLTLSERSLKASLRK